MRWAALAVTAASLAASAGCGGPARARPSPSPREPTARAEGWIYEVGAGPRAADLSVAATFPAGSAEELIVDDGAEPFVRDVEVWRGAAWEPIAPRDGSWIVALCKTEGCRVRYRFALQKAAESIADPDVAIAHEGALLAPPSTWLLRPAVGPMGLPFRFHVKTPPGVAFATGVFPSSSQPSTFQADVADLASAPYSGFGALRPERMEIDGSALEIAIAPGTFALGERAVLQWIRSCAAVVARYFGRFPVRRAALFLLPSTGHRAGFGKALGHGGASILLPLGKAMRAEQLRDDWVLVHEMIHLGFPSLAFRHRWLEEGIATYVEPIARARAGALPIEEVWRGLVRGLPEGLPQKGDEGLDNTPTWGRTYWGGALFCLLADLAIRERTSNRRSFDDALRGVLAAGGDISVRWDIERVLDEGDRATGVPVLHELYQRMASRPLDVDLPALWQKLGVTPKGDRVTFDERAPLAAIRRSVTEDESARR